MYCPQCGTPSEEQFKFCQDCGTSLETSRGSAGRTASARMDLHFQILGWLFIGSAVLTGMLSGGIFLAGWFLRASSLPFPPAEFGPEALALFSAIVSVIAVAMAVTAAVSVIAGIGLLQYQTWGRVMALIAASLIITKIPIGTAIGVYAFWVLLSVEGREHFKHRVPQLST